MNRIAKIVVCVAAVLAATGNAGRAAVVGDLQVDYSTPTPASGWSYLWNDNGAIGNPANYDALSYNGGVYSPGGLALPTAAPGNFLFLGGAGSLQPGAAEGQGGNAVERFVIAAFTLSGGGLATINNLTLSTDASPFDGVDL